ncbi:MAG: hypothetical protein AABX66_04310 [Nanoarchaeota archaeon]
MKKSKYIAPICAGLIVLTGAGLIGKGFSDVYKDQSNKFHELKRLFEVQGQASHLRFEFNKTFSPSDEVSPKKLFENNQERINALRRDYDQISALEKEEDRIIHDPILGQLYKKYTNLEAKENERGILEALAGVCLFLPAGIYLIHKYKLME